MSASEHRARGDNFVIGFININKYTSASENVPLCLKKTRQLGHISVATGRIPSLFCAVSPNVVYNRKQSLLGVKMIVESYQSR